MPKEKKPRAKKDPNAPKKALSAFMIFSSENRSKVKEENPDAGFGDMGRLLGARWKEMGDAEKQLYQDKADKDKIRYEKDMIAFKAGDYVPTSKSPVVKSPVAKSPVAKSPVAQSPVKSPAHSPAKSPVATSPVKSPKKE